MTEAQLKQKMNERGLSLVEGPLARRCKHLTEAIKILLPPKTISDRTCYRRVAQWVAEKCRTGNYSETELLRRVIDFALEASNPQVKKPPAVFMYILKKELGYPN